MLEPANPRDLEVKISEREVKISERERERERVLQRRHVPVGGLLVASTADATAIRHQHLLAP